LLKQKFAGTALLPILRARVY